MILGTRFEATVTIFELYLPGEQPTDVEIPEENWRRFGLLPIAADRK